MATSRDTPNPLRPYYRPPSIGIPQDTPVSLGSVTHELGRKSGSASLYASSARDIFSDIDYAEYLSESSPSVLDSVRSQIDSWFYTYMSVLLAQPFDVAKTVLQARRQNKEESLIPVTTHFRSKRADYMSNSYTEYPSDDSDPDEPAYFTSSIPSSASHSSKRRRYDSDRSRSPHSKPTAHAHQLILKRSDSISEVISQEWSKEGAWGVWKGSNTTFVYGILFQTLEKWFKGLLLALLNLPDAGMSAGLESSVELAGLPYSSASLGISVAAAVAAGIILAPLDLIRIKLMLTPTATVKRSLVGQLRALNSYLCAPALLVPTILYSLVTPTVTNSTPVFLRAYLSIDPSLTPNAYQLARFMSRSVELFLKLPLETVLRRAQMAVIKRDTEVTQEDGTSKAILETTVEVGEYRGVIGTMWMIVTEEGVGRPLTIKGRNARIKEIKGQGLPGLWRGWRVGMWGLFGIWGSRALNGGSGSGIGEF